MGDMIPAACPRCGSTDPAVRLPVAYRVFICNDPWHDRPTGVTVSDPCPKCGVPAPGHCDCDRPTEADDLAARLEASEQTGATMCFVRTANVRAAAARLRELEAVEDDQTWLRAELDDLRAERDRLRIERDALLELLGQNADEGWRER